MPLFRKGLEICVQLAKASVAIDKTRILNSIRFGPEVAPARLNEDVPAEGDPAFAAVNVALGGMFAEVSLRAAALEGKFESAVQVFAKDKARTRARFDLPGVALASLSALATSGSVSFRVV